MIHRFILHNNDICEAAEKVLSPGQVGLLSGWGVFSTLRVCEGVLFAFDRHWARVARDAAALHVPVPEDPAQLHEKLLELVEANGAFDATLRLAIVRNTGTMWAGPSVGRAVDILALTADVKPWGKGVRLACTPHSRHAACRFAGAKTLSWAMNLTWLESAQQRGFDETLLLNERGEVAECTSANIFAAFGDQVWTPPLDSGCLPGITREVLLELRAPGFQLLERPLTVAQLEAADEVFITSTTRELLHVSEIEGKPTGRDGRARAALQGAFSTYMEQYIAEHKKRFQVT